MSIRGGVRAALPAASGYVAVRALGVFALWWAGGRSLPALWHSLTERYDAGPLLTIAAEGYDDGSAAPSNLAFFPLFPFLARVLGTVVGIPTGALIVSWVAGVACATALFFIGRRLGSPAMGTMLAVLWGALPHAITESMAYTESLFTALAAWALFAVLSRRWVLAGALTAFAGLTRATAAALIAVVGLAAIVELVRTRGRSWRAWLGGAISPLGWIGYIAWVSTRTGGVDGWLAVQRGWGTTFDGGRYTASTFWAMLSGQTTLQLLTVTVIIAVAIMLLAISAAERVRWELQLYGLLVVVLAFGAAGYYQSKARLILPAFTLLIPVAQSLARARRTTALIVLGAAALASAWYGAYLLVHAPYSP